MRGEQEAIVVAPPRSSGSSHISAAKKLSFTTSSSAEQTTNGGYWTFYATSDVHLAFYDITGSLAAATLSDMFIPAGQERNYFVEGVGFFKAIGHSSGGDLYFHRSSP